MVPDVDNQGLSERLDVCAARSAIVPFPDYAKLTSEFMARMSQLFYDSIDPYRYYVSANSALPRRDQFTVVGRRRHKVSNHILAQFDAKCLCDSKPVSEIGTEEMAELPQLNPLLR